MALLITGFGEEVALAGSQIAVGEYGINFGINDKELGLADRRASSKTWNRKIGDRNGRF